MRFNKFLYVFYIALISACGGASQVQSEESYTSSVWGALAHQGDDIGSGLRARFSKRLMAIGKRLGGMPSASQASNRPQALLSREIVNTVLTIDGIPRDYLEDGLQHLVAPDRKTCGEVSCARIFDLQPNAIGTYLDRLGHSLESSVALKASTQSWVRQVLVSSFDKNRFGGRINLRALPRHIRMDQKSSYVVTTLSMPQRRSLYMQLEHLGRHPEAQDQFAPTHLKYIEVPTDIIRFQVVVNRREKGVRNRERVLDYLRSPKPGYIRIPVHPATVEHHPVIQDLLAAGHKLEASNLQVTMPTMSRSLWAGDGDGLYTIKMPTNKVGKQQQDRKLVGGAYSMDHLVLQLNTINDKTSIPDQMQRFGLHFLMDNGGFVAQIAGKSAKDAYAFSIRDYDALMQEKDFIFMPQQTLLSPHGQLVADANGTKTFVLHISPSHKLTINQNEMIKISEQLMAQTGILNAIFHGNGISYLDFHSQNVMIGISFDGARAKLGLRDVSDHEDILRRENGHFVIKKAEVSICRFDQIRYDMTGRSAEIYQRLMKIQIDAYIKTLKALGMRLPPGHDWSEIQHVYQFPMLMAKPEYAGHFAGEILKVRDKNHQ